MLANLNLTPGIVLDETAASNEGGFSGGDRVRFKNKKLLSIGGWAPRIPDTLTGKTRGAHDWADERGQRLLAWGTETSLYALYGGAKIDITPPLMEGVLVKPFSTKAGSTTVTVLHPNHGLVSGNTITFSNATPIAGLTLNGTFVVSFVTVDSYTIAQSFAASSSTVSGATDTVDYISPLPAGNTDGFVSGWGTGAWNAGSWGGSAGGDPEPRIWSFDNIGSYMLANPRGLGIYEWQPTLNPPETVIDGIFSDATQWGLGTGWAVTGGQAVATAGTASPLSQPTASRIQQGRMYRVTFDVVVTTPGQLYFKNGAGSPIPASVSVGDASTFISRSGTYSRTFRAAPGITDIRFEKDASFAGTIDNLSIKLEAKAYLIKGAPKHVDWMWVDPARVLVALSTVGFDGTFSPMLARWSALDNVEDWTPLDTNVSGELPLSGGARLMTGVAMRSENLVLSDTSAFRFAFTGTTQGFAQKLIGTGCGVIGRNAAVEWNGTAYWMSLTGFYLYSGGTPQRIFCPVERYVLDNLADLQNEKIYAGVNPQYNEVWWCYPDERDGIECSRVVCYNFAEQVWTVHTIARTCWVASGLFPNPIAFSTDGRMFEHEVGTNANGAPINWWADAAPVDIEDGESLETIIGLMPDVKNQIGTVTYEVSCRLYPNGDYLPTDVRTADPTTRVVRFRRKGRQCKIRIWSVSQESAFHMGTPKLDLAKAEAKQ